MANNILLKKSSVSAKVPTTADLDYGELALNYADGALYYKTSGNGIARLNPPESIGFANVAVSGQSTLVADTATGTLTIAAGGAITLTTNAITDTLTIAHTDTSSVANLSSTNTGGTVIQSATLTFDTYGHVQTATVGTVNLDGRYLTAESDTLATVTTRGATTTNAITVGGLTVNGNATITGDLDGIDSLTFDTTATEANAVGKLYWNANDGTLSFGLVGGNSINHIGQHLTNYVYNDDTTTIAKGEVVYLFAAHGNRASVKKASNAAEATSSKTLGVASENIAPGAVGFVVSHGVVDGLSLGAYNPGDLVYLGNTPGTITATLPVAPNHTVFVGVVARANNGNGQLFVKVNNGLQIDELHDVQISGLANNDSLFYNSSAYVWQNTTPTNARTKLGLGTIATQNANSVAITGGAIDGTPVGATTPSTGKFTSLQTTGNVTIGGNLTISGTTTTVAAQNLTVSDNMIYLNNGIQTTITNVSGSGTVITYTTAETHNYSTNMVVTVTGVNPSQYNITNQTITGVGTNTFTVAGSATGSYVSGGTARAKSGANPDLGWAAGYNDGTYAHTGFFRDATDGYYKVFKGYTPEPDTDIYIDTSHASFALADIQAANFRGALVGNATTASTLAGTPTINGVTFNGGSNITVTANTTNALTIGAGLSGTSFNGSAAVTITVDNTVARVNDTLYVGTTAIALNRASAAQTLTGVSISGNAATVTNGIYTTDTGTVTNTMLAGSITNAKLVNSSITIAGTSTALGGSITQDTITGLSATGIIKRTGANTLAIATAGTDYVVPSGSITGSAGSVTNALTLGSYLTGGSYNGSAAITAAVDATSANTASKVVARDASGNFSAGTITANLTGTASGNLTSSSSLAAANLTGTIPSAVLGTSALYVGTTSVALNRASASLALTGVSIDGTASNITAYTINQNLGTGNSPTFVNLRATGILYDSSNAAGTSGQVLTSTGTGTAWSSTGASVTGSGTTGKIPKWSSSTGLTDSIIVESSSSIGIGKSPGITLDVLGASGLDGSHAFNMQMADTKAYNLSPASGSSVSLKYNAAGTYAGMGGWAVAKENTTDGDVASFYTIHTRPTGGSISERVRVTSAGNVGVGTNSPAYKLDVAGTIRSNSSLFTTNGSSAVWDFTEISSNGTTSIYNAGGAESGISFRFDGTERVFFAQGGNVGIGTSTPSVKLHVIGDAIIGTNGQRISIFDDGNAHIHSTSGPLWLNASDASDVRINNQNNGNVVLANGTGKVGVGTASPTQALDVNGNIAYGTDHVFAYYTLTTTTTASNQVVASIASATYRVAKFVVQAVDATAGKYQTQEILAIHNGSSASHTEYTAINIGGAVATFDVDFSVNAMRLLCNPLSTNSTVFKVQASLIKV